MNRIERYLGRSLIAAFMLVCLVFISLYLLVGLMEEASVLRPGYQWPQAFIYVCLTLPASINQILPAGVLLGALLGLGQLATQSELTVIRACGWSKTRIFGACFKSLVPLMLLQWALSELIVPQAEQWADHYREQRLSGGMMLRSASGIWAREGQDFIHIGEVFPDGLLLNLTIFRFNPQNQLQQVLKAERALPKPTGWLLEQVQQSDLSQRPLVASLHPQQLWATHLEASQLKILSVSPDKLSTSELIKYRQHLLANGQRTQEQDLVIYNKILSPLAQPILLLLALCFLFGSQRSQPFGQRLVYGILVGFSYALSAKTFNSMALVYDLPAGMMVLLPSVVFGSVAWFWLRKT